MVVLSWPVARTKMLVRLASADESILGRLHSFDAYWSAAHNPEEGMSPEVDMEIEPQDHEMMPGEIGANFDEIGGGDAGGVPDYLR